MWDACWRAGAYCLHPRVLLWSLLPLLLAGALVGGLGVAYWEGAVAGVRQTLQDWALTASALRWLDSWGLQTLRALLAPMIVVALALPLVLMVTLLLVALLVTPAVVRTVVARRFAGLHAERGASWLQSLLWTLLCTFAALLALLVSMPLWLVPPLVLLLPPFIWGWLTYRVMGFDVLAHHASAAERRFVLRHRRATLLWMGLICGALATLPSLLWSAGAPALILAPVLAVVSVWLYTAIFAFSACWFAHYALAELQALRQAQLRTAQAPAAVLPPALPAGVRHDPT
jgi:hypothetical protein